VSELVVNQSVTQLISQSISQLVGESIYSYIYIYGSLIKRQLTFL